MEKVRIGIIGAGWWATAAHIPAVKSRADAELIAVQSREKAKAERIASDFDVRHACVSIGELLALSEIEAVIISSTPNVHFMHAKAALQSGRHVLLEKPMTITAAQARELVELAASQRVHLLMSCPWHYTRHAIQARELIKSGVLGEIKMISMLMTNPIDELLRGLNTFPTHDGTEVYVQPRPGSYSDPAIAGGGQIYCQVSHAAAYLAFLTGHRAAEVFAQFDNDGSANDIYNTLNLKLENGAMVAIASTGATPLKERNFEVRIFGTKAILQLELWRGTMSLIDFEDRRTEFPPLMENEVYPAQAPALNFMDTVLGKAPNGSPGELGLASMEIIEAACESAQTRRNEIIRPVRAPVDGFLEKPQFSLKGNLLKCFILFFSLCALINANAQNPLENLHKPGADWGIWIDNGLVKPEEVVRMTVSVPLNTPSTNLPATLEVHPRYLEDTQAVMEEIPLNWNPSSAKKRWQARVDYRPRQAGNYYASIQFYGHEIFSYFAAWKPGITAVNFWMDMPAEYHSPGNLKNIYLPEAEAGHLPFDYELVLVGELVFKPDWKPRELFRQAQVEAGAEVIPFLDGGYFHKLDPEFTGRFEAITNQIEGYHELVSKETQAIHGFKKLPDPTFHSLTVEQCSAVIEGAQRYWKEWGFRPFTGVATYSPSDTLVESCRRKGVKWISGVFADYDFTDGTDRWEVGWRQRHHGMPSFPYLISTTDYRLAGTADRQGTMMFQGWQDQPVWDHENRHQYGTDPGGANGSGRPSGVDLARMMRYTQVFERDNVLAKNAFPLAETFCIQMDNPNNSALIQQLIDRSRQGNLIFIHKRYLQTYFREHHIDVSPDVTYTIPDSEFEAAFPTGNPYTFSDEAVWEGADGKAAFISDQTAPLEKGRSIHLPVWWYDYRNAAPLSPKLNYQSVNLSGVSLEVEKSANGPRLIIESPRKISGLPICLWDLDAGMTKGATWIKENRAMRIAAPERMGTNTVMWIIRPNIKMGKTEISL